MTSLAGSPTEASRSNLKDMLERCIALVAVVFALGIAWYIVSRLNVGLDVSDSAYYIISYAMHRDIESQSTLAGWLWASISPFDGVLANRYFGVVFLLACFAALWWHGSRANTGDWAGKMIALAFALSGVLVYYMPWLPDPSYNSINLGFISLGWAGFFGLLHSTERNECSVAAGELFWSLIVGLAVASVFLAKPTSAALIGPALLGSYLAFARHWLHLRRIAALALATFVGFSLPFLALAGNGEGPVRIFTTMRNGLDAGSTIAALPINPFHPLLQYASSIVSALLLREWYTWVAIIAIVLTLSDSFSSRFRLKALVRVAICTSAAIGFPLLSWKNDAFTHLESTINTIVVFAFVLAIGAIFCAPRGKRRSLVFLCVAMIVSPFIYAFGTGNPWAQLIAGAAGFAFLALGAVVSALCGVKQLVAGISGLGLLAFVLIGTAIGIEKHPYRLSAPLSSLKSAARVGPFGETFFDSPSQAEFYNKLANIRPLLAQLPERPYLIDLSGRVPMVAFQIGAKPPRTPWLLSAYPGSIALFHLVVGKISQQELSRAWVFQAPGYAARFPDTILQEYGLDFPADYVPLTTVPIQYLGVDGTLYAPKNAVNNVN